MNQESAYIIKEVLTYENISALTAEQDEFVKGIVVDHFFVC